MKIAQIAPVIERVPPKKYGGTERVVSTLTEELVKRGHEVTLFASGDSITKAKLVSVYPRGIREAKLKDIYGTNIWTLLNIGACFAMQDQFDIIHDHNLPISIPTAHLATTPTVVTMHGPFNRENRRLLEELRGPNIVSISRSQAALAPNTNHVGTVYNGLDLKGSPFSNEHDGYLLFVGRISMEKGPHLAIEVAQNLNLPLIIAAKLESLDRPYFKEYIEPHLTENIKWIGEVDEGERNKLMSRAMAMLHPITWREPFGLTLIEAMATGCPVVAINNGSIPEVIVQGKTGFVVSDADEMTDAVANISAINRADCRTHVLENFSGEKMTDGYEEIYRQLLEKKNTESKIIFPQEAVKRAAVSVRARGSAHRAIKQEKTK